jgi:hypothetical protein
MRELLESSRALKKVLETKEGREQYIDVIRQCTTPALTPEQDLLLRFSKRGSA